MKNKNTTLGGVALSMSVTSLIVAVVSLVVQLVR